ncbi:sigma-54-dependent Fis family transcriptional regulator [Thermoflavimicrobium dichotomicum]|uniref:Transcriptional regulator of acetoin/glycerol metabolism n=1 Tax=Thermoflavimicrobium dichotomicum TaxID=46223 RepID=A0A1I3JG65_9BACL|nr:sigma-54-dependent Fis family transcriptional regulator [Thermoflavimicrobium dichotomicum]SFI59156.1 Transcriptional regulator of acetoin/glycerol metabolism [Thermoflavimicrobium dichotomicum]
MKSVVITKFDEFNDIDRLLMDKWEKLLSDSEVPEYNRSIITSSWKRCLAKKIDPLRKEADVIYSGDDLKEQQEKNQFLLEIASPYIDELFEYYSGQPTLVMLTDPKGIILKGIATSEAWAKVDPIRFVPGADWSEEASGTNAIGTAIIEGKPTQVFAAEHFCQGWHPWVCSAAPIRDPFTNQLLGVLDLTAEKRLVQAHDLHLITSQVRKIEHEIRNIISKQNLTLIENIMDIIHDPLVIFDAQGRITRYNSPALHLLRIQSGEFIQTLFGCSMNDIKDKSCTMKLSKHGQEWAVQFQPYKIDTRFMGGMALFRKITPSNTKFKQLSTTSLSLPASSTRYRFDQIITRNPKMKHVIQLAKKAAFSDKTLLITGESGVGKEVFAQSVHSLGPRNRFPFVSINCGAIQRDLLASELFGYAPGTFTGADPKGKKGKFELAHKGTLFLDEIGELPLEAQAYLLRVLEEQVVVPVGGSDPIQVDVRVIAATNRDLAQEVKNGNFREDLFYRLNVLHLEIPPLRERKEDIPLLVNHFLYSQKEKDQIQLIDTSALEKLMQYHWPGNVRQLKNVLDKAMFHDQDGCISEEDLPAEIIGSAKRCENKASDGDFRDKKHKLSNPVITKEMLTQTLKLTGGNISKTARLLQVSRTTIYRKMSKFGLLM